LSDRRERCAAGLKPARPHPDQKVRGEAVSMDFNARAEKFFAE